jgi:hypothetical protein
MLLVRQKLHVFSFRHGPHLANLLRRRACRAIKQWLLASLREKRLKIGAKVLRHECYVISFGTRWATETLGCSPPMAYRKPHRLLLSTLFQSSSGERLLKWPRPFGRQNEHFSDYSRL